MTTQGMVKVSYQKGKNAIAPDSLIAEMPGCILLKIKKVGVGVGPENKTFLALGCEFFRQLDLLVAAAMPSSIKSPIDGFGESGVNAVKTAGEPIKGKFNICMRNPAQVRLHVNPEDMRGKAKTNI